MEEEDLIILTPENYQEWSQWVIPYLSQHNALPYARGLLYNEDIGSIIFHTLFLFMDMEVMDSLDDMKSSNLYDYWIHLWELYGDPHIPPFPKDLQPLVVGASSPDEITPPNVPISTLDPFPATNALDSL